MTGLRDHLGEERGPLIGDWKLAVWDMHDETSNPSSFSEGHIMIWLKTRKCCRENVTPIECPPFQVVLMGQGKGGGAKVMPLYNMDNFVWWWYVIWVAGFLHQRETFYFTSELSYHNLLQR